MTAVHSVSEEQESVAAVFIITELGLPFQIGVSRSCFGYSGRALRISTSILPVHSSVHKLKKQCTRPNSCLLISSSKILPGNGDIDKLKHHFSETTGSF